jgi:hypothetical protein
MLLLIPMSPLPPIGSMWLSLQSADPSLILIEPVTGFVFPQHVCGCACKVQTPLLILLPPVHSYSMYVIVLAKCRPPCWCHCNCLPAACMWLYLVQTHSLILFPPMTLCVVFFVSLYVITLSGYRPLYWFHQYWSHHDCLSTSVYVIVLAKFRPFHWYHHHLIACM